DALAQDRLDLRRRTLREQGFPAVRGERGVAALQRRDAAVEQGLLVRRCEGERALEELPGAPGDRSRVRVQQRLAEIGERLRVAAFLELGRALEGRDRLVPVAELHLRAPEHL